MHNFNIQEYRSRNTHTHMHTCAYAKYTSVSVDYMMMHIYDIQQIREHI